MNESVNATVALLDAVRAAARQEQFLEVVSAEEAKARFEKQLDLAPLAAETVSLADALGRVLAHDVAAPIDVPPFDRSNVDGFALRAADTAGATDATPRRLSLNAEVLACGHAPRLTVAPGTATAIATGGMIPRGADAVVMIEQTELIDAAAPAIDLRRAASPGAFVSYAGSDIARGETLLRRGAIDLLARDRHAGGVRLRKCRRGTAAEGCGAVDRRRTGGARCAAAAGRGL